MHGGCAVRVTVANRYSWLGWRTVLLRVLGFVCLFNDSFTIGCNVATFLLRFAMPQQQAAQPGLRISWIMFLATTANLYQPPPTMNTMVVSMLRFPPPSSILVDTFCTRFATELRRRERSAIIAKLNLNI